jgi:hypothetical protein
MGLHLEAIRGRAGPWTEWRCVRSLRECAHLTSVSRRRAADDDASMSFEAFAQPPLDRLITDAASTQQLTVMLGAGASIEAGLPSWPTLISGSWCARGPSAGC